MDARLHDIAPVWAEAVRDGREFAFFSPFITPDILGRVFGDAPLKGGRIYTLFRVRNFASGASSLEALNALLVRGMSLFELPRLHAKMLIVPGVFASVGSQNLTLMGTRNLEATAVTSDLTEVARITEEASKWAALAKPITSERLQEAQREVDAIRKTAERLKDLAKRAERRLRRAAQARDAALAAPDTPTVEAKPDDENAGGELETVSVGRVVIADIRARAGAGQVGVVRDGKLICEAGKFTRWPGIEVTRLAEVICFSEDTARWAWVRVGEGVIGFFYTALDYSNVKFGDLVCDLAFESILEPNAKYNLRVLVSLNRRSHGGMGEPLGEFTGWLTPRGVERLERHNEQFRRRFNAIGEVTKDQLDFWDWCLGNHDRIADVLARTLFDPGRLGRGAYSGEKPAEFFGREDKTYRIWACQSAGGVVFVAREETKPTHPPGAQREA